MSVLLNYPGTVLKEIVDIASNIKDHFLSCGTYDEEFFDQLPDIENAFLVSKLSIIGDFVLVS